MCFCLHHRWKLLDFAELKRSSISFFAIEKHVTAVSRWSRARTKAAKVGKGMSKNEKAQKLALQHWLEAVSYYRETHLNFQFPWIELSLILVYCHRLTRGIGMDTTCTFTTTSGFTVRVENLSSTGSYFSPTPFPFRSKGFELNQEH